jgi:DNA-binding NtrC family response regulator
MMSAAASQSSLDPSIAGFLRKPFDLDRLLAIINRLIGPANAVSRS